MIARIALSIVVAIVVALVCLLLGDIVATQGAAVPVLAVIGNFLSRFAWVLGLLAGAWFYFSGSLWPRRPAPPG